MPRITISSAHFAYGIGRDLIRVAKGCAIDEHNDLGDAIDYQGGLRVGRGILTTPLLDNR
jgi:hypothetical protein